jgi:paraquat-inducible protein B
VERYAFVFGESVRGLSVGAPVDFRGIVIGEVIDVGVLFDANAQRIDMRVNIHLFPERLFSRARIVSGHRAPLGSDAWRAEWQQLVDAGLRGQLRTGNLLTGQRYIAIDFFPTAPPVEIDWSKSPLELPTIPGGLQGLQESLASVASKLDRVPYEELAAELGTALKSLNLVLADVDQLVRRVDTDITPQLQQTLAQARASLVAAERTLGTAERTVATDAPIAMEMRRALQEVGRTAQSLRALADYLERHPEALLRGK